MSLEQRAHLLPGASPAIPEDESDGPGNNHRERSDDRNGAVRVRDANAGAMPFRFPDALTDRGGIGDDHVEDSDDDHGADDSGGDVAARVAGLLGQRRGRLSGTCDLSGYDAVLATVVLRAPPEYRRNAPGLPSLGRCLPWKSRA